VKWYRQIFNLEDPEALMQMADDQEQRQDLHKAASLLDRAYGLRPHDAALAERRHKLLHSLAREHEGARYCYVPAGYFLMGSQHGEPDERPVHAAFTEAFWMAEVPVNWWQFCQGMGYLPPPLARPETPSDLDEGMGFLIVNSMRHPYCEDHARGASDWHNHFYEAVGEEAWPYAPDREPKPHGYSLKPVVAVSLKQAQQFCQRLGLRLPSETEWEKAARGGLIGQPYPWGSQPPDSQRCDFNRFEEFSILPSRQFPANGYGLYAMSGGVWEWTSSRYDALAYRRWLGSSLARQYVVRGGSWADCAEAVTVSFRDARPADPRPSANQGFRPVLSP